MKRFEILDFSGWIRFLLLTLLVGGILAEAPSAHSQTVDGNKRVLVVLMNFTADAREPYSAATARSTVFETTNSFFQEASYGRVSLSGDVAGWFTSSAAPTCDLGTISTLANTFAANAGYPLENYDYYVYALPGIANCPASGYHTLGTRSIVVNTVINPLTLAHEFGHAFGLQHANAYECGTVAYGPNANCYLIEYGDHYDAMGSRRNGATLPNHYNAIFKEQLGWLPVPAVTQSGVYELFAYQGATSSTRAVKIPVRFGTRNYTYYLEYRQNIGFDREIFANARNAVFVHRSGGGSAILDMTPNATGNDYTDRVDPWLSIGSSFVDSDGGVTITPLSTTTNSIFVNIALSRPLDTTPPSVSILSPQSGVLSSGAFTVSASVTDNDRLADVLLLVNGFDNGLLAKVENRYEGFLDLTWHPPGEQLVSIRAIDRSGNEQLATVSVTTTDSVPPGVWLTRPWPGETLSESVLLEAGAHDNGAIQKIEFLVDGVLVGQALSEPYSFNWNTRTVTNGLHSITAKATDTSGLSATSHSSEITVSNTQFAPRNLQLTSRTLTSLAISWQPPLGQTVKGYRMDVATDSSFTTFLSGYNNRNLGNVLTRSVTSLFPGKNYFVRLRSYDASGRISENSATLATATLSDTLAPTSPTGLSASSITQTSFVLNWNASTDNDKVANYLLDLSLASNFSSDVGSYKGKAVNRPRSVSGLVRGKSYFARVRAKDRSGNLSGYSPVLRITTLP